MESLGIALEGQIGLPRSEDQLAAFEASVQRAKEAGASVLRAVCLGEDGMRLSNRSHPGKRFRLPRSAGKSRTGDAPPSGPVGCGKPQGLENR